MCRRTESPWRRKWQPTPIFLPGESHGQKSLVGYGLWGCKESDISEHMHTCKKGMTAMADVFTKCCEKRLLLLFSGRVMSDFSQPQELQHARLPCPSPSPGACPNSCPLHWWCHPTSSSSASLFSSCLQSFPTSGSFPMSWLFTSGGLSIGASASASVFPMNIQDWFPLGLTGWSPCCPRDCQESSLASQFESINPSLEDGMATHYSILAMRTPWTWTLWQQIGRKSRFYIDKGNMKGFKGDGAFELGLQGWVGVCQEDEQEGYSRQRKQHKGLWCDRAWCGWPDGLMRLASRSFLRDSGHMGGILILVVVCLQAHFSTLLYAYWNENVILSLSSGCPFKGSPKFWWWNPKSLHWFTRPCCNLAPISF